MIHWAMFSALAVIVTSGFASIVLLVLNGHGWWSLLIVLILVSVQFSHKTTGRGDSEPTP